MSTRPASHGAVPAASSTDWAVGCNVHSEPNDWAGVISEPDGFYAQISRNVVDGVMDTLNLMQRLILVLKPLLLKEILCLTWVNLVRKASMYIL